MNQDAFFGNMHDLFKSNDISTTNEISSVNSSSKNEIPFAPIINQPVAWQISSPKQTQSSQMTDLYETSSVFEKDGSFILSDVNSKGQNFLQRLNCLSILEKTFCGVAFGSSLFIILLVVVLLVTTFQHNQNNPRNKKVKEPEQDDK